VGVGVGVEGVHGANDAFWESFHAVGGIAGT
jgi:hypothetical protein